MQLLLASIIASLMLVGVAFAECPMPTADTGAAMTPAPVAAAPSVPSAIGAGPAADLRTLTGTAFDEAYIRHMYQLHAVISTVTTQGYEQTTDGNLRELSAKIRTEQVDMNQKLALWSREKGLGRIPVDYIRVAEIDKTLPLAAGERFDVSYAGTLISLLQQQRDVAQLAVDKAVDPKLKQQAQLAIDASNNETEALQRWVPES